MLAPMSDDDLKSQWLQHCLHLARRPSVLWRSSRKHARDYRLTVSLDDSLRLEHVGYVERKQDDLAKLYLHEESRAVALEQWAQRKKGCFTSVAFHTFNHLVKRSGRVGTQGPCMLSVTVTDIGSEAVANIAYRSIEVCKKFPADLIFVRDVLLQPFEVRTVVFHIANVTMHPLYFPILFPLLNDPVEELRRLHRRDPRFWRAVVCESADLLCGGSRNANFMQAQRVARHVLERTDRATLRELRSYLRILN